VRKEVFAGAENRGWHRRGSEVNGRTCEAAGRGPERWIAREVDSSRVLSECHCASEGVAYSLLLRLLASLHRVDEGL
jgi:hypothetical protein